MRAKSLALLALALGCGLVASVGITQVLAKRNGDNPASTLETSTIYVALKDVALGDVLTTDVLRPEPWPKDKVPAGAIRDLQDIDGRRTRTKLYAGEPILENKLFAKGASNNTSNQVPANFRVASVKVDMVSGSGLILPGDRVDVFVYLVKNPQRGINETMARMILQDVKVFAVNDVVNLENDKDNRDAKSIQAKTISLLVTPEQAAKVALASELGKIRLVMRGPEDDKAITDSKDIEARPYALFGDVEGSHRSQESLVRDTPVEPAPIEPAPTAPAVAQMPNEQWTVRVLQPGAVNDVLFERSGKNDKAGNSDKPWHNASASNGEPESQPAEPNAKPATAAPMEPSAAPAKSPTIPQPEPAQPAQEIAEPDES